MIHKIFVLHLCRWQTYLGLGLHGVGDVRHGAGPGLDVEVAGLLTQFAARTSLCRRGAPPRPQSAARPRHGRAAVNLGIGGEHSAHLQPRQIWKMTQN